MPLNVTVMGERIKEVVFYILLLTMMMMMMMMRNTKLDALWMIHFTGNFQNPKLGLILDKSENKEKNSHTQTQ